MDVGAQAPSVREEEPAPTVFMVDERVDPDKMLFEGIDTSSGPVYTISEVSKFFLIRGAHWTRCVERDGRFSLDGKPHVPRRTPKGARYYLLEDVEQMVHGLAQNGLLAGGDLGRILVLLKTEAQLYGILPSADRPRLWAKPKEEAHE
jgi:hypothetical protein